MAADARTGRRRRGPATVGAVALAVLLGGCSAVADLDRYRFGGSADAGAPDGGADAGVPPIPPPPGVAQTAGGADLRGARYELTIRFGAPPPSGRLEGRRYDLTLGGSTRPRENTR